MTKRQILQLVNDTERPQIRAGDTHRFIDIWIVVADDRLFCRQYYFSEKSWCAAFLNDRKGSLKCGDVAIDVEGVIPDDLDQIQEKINQAYIEKYVERFTTFPGVGRKMTGPLYEERTMELVIKS